MIRSPLFCEFLGFFATRKHRGGGHFASQKPKKSHQLLRPPCLKGRQDDAIKLAKQITLG